MAEKLVELDVKEFDKLVKNKDKMLLVMFYTNVCPNCKAIMPTYKELSGEMEKYAVFGLINAQEQQALAIRYGVMAVPTFKFFCADQPIGEIVGSVNATILRNTIKDLTKHKNQCISKSTPISYEMDGYM